MVAPALPYLVLVVHLKYTLACFFVAVLAIFVAKVDLAAFDLSIM